MDSERVAAAATVTRTGRRKIVCRALAAMQHLALRLAATLGAAPLRRRNVLIPLQLFPGIGTIAYNLSAGANSRLLYL